MMVRAVLPGVMAGAVCAGGVLAGEPRSAIPWLSQSIAPAQAPAASPRLEPEAAPLPLPPVRDDRITVTTLGGVSRESVGLLSPQESGLPRDLWGAAPAEEVRELILGHDMRGVPAALSLFHRLLLAEADPPPGSGPASGILVARIDRLLEMGALQEADDLIAAAGADSPEIFRRWFDTGLLLNQTRPACEALRGNPSLSPTLPARVICLARGGDWNAAEITLTLGEGVGSIPPEQERMLARFLDPALFEGEPDPPAPDPQTPIDFLLREAVGLPRPAGALPPAFLWADLDEHFPMRTRVTAAERLVLTDAIPGGQLFEAYRAGEPAASGGIWDRAAAIQNFDAALASGQDVSAALGKADKAMRGRGLRVAFAQEYADQIAQIKPADLSEAARREAVELLLLAGVDEAAARLAGNSPRKRVSQLLAIGGSGNANISSDDPMVRAALEGLQDRDAMDEREIRMDALLEDGRQGPAILAALGAINAGPSVDPAALRASLHTLRRAGLEQAARAIALETLLLDGAG